MAERAVTVRILGDASQLERVFGRTARSGDELTNKLERQGTKLVAAGKAMTVGVTAPAILAFKKATDAASGLNEQVDAADAIFGQSASQIQAWSQTTAKSFGISRRAALQAAVGYGNMLQTAGLVPAQAAKMGMSLVELAADMASFNDQDPSEMLDKLRSGLAGESEPLRRFGVNISAATVEAKALELGLADANGELSEGAKVQARYAVIMEQTARQQGNFAATSEGVANKQRIANAVAEDGAASWGQVLLPAVKVVQDAFIALGGFLARMPGGVKAVVSAFVGLAAITGPILLAIGKIKLMRAELRRLNAESATSVGGLTGKLGAFAKRAVIPATLAITAAIGVYAAWRDAKERLTRATETLTDAIKTERDGVAGAANDAIIQELQTRKLLDDFAAAQVPLARAIRFVRGEITLTDDELARLDGVASNISLAFDFFTQSAAGAGGQLVELRDAFAEGRIQAGQIDKAVKDLGATVKETGQQVLTFAGMTGEELTNWQEGTIAAINPVDDALSDLADEADLTAAKILESFREQAKALGEYEKNWNTLVQRGLPDSLAKQLQEMGIEGAGIVAALTKANKREFDQIIAKWQLAETRSARIGSAIERNLSKKITIPVDFDVASLSMSSTTEQRRFTEGRPRSHGGGVIHGNPNDEIPILAAARETIRTPRQEAELRAGIQQLASSIGGGIDYERMAQAFMRALAGSRLALDADGFVRLVSDRIGRQAALTARTA